MDYTTIKQEAQARAKVAGQRFLDDYGVAVTDADPKTVEAFTQLVADEAAVDEARG